MLDNAKSRKALDLETNVGWNEDAVLYGKAQAVLELAYELLDETTDFKLSREYIVAVKRREN